MLNLIKSLPPTQFSDDEAMAVALVLSTIAIGLAIGIGLVMRRST